MSASRILVQTNGIGFTHGCDFNVCLRTFDDETSEIIVFTAFLEHPSLG